MSGFDDVGSGFRFDQTDVDAHVRSAAFAEVRRLTQLFGGLTSQHLAAGFHFAGNRIPLVNPQRGIFKPKQMRHLLSIKTVYPRPGRKVWYDDQREVAQQIYNGDDVVDYAFMGKDPDAADNRWLQDAMKFQTPVIYFLGTAPGLYQAIVPTFIVGFDRKKLRANLAFASLESATTAPRDAAERRYALRTVKQRIHQASFREMIIDAYRGRCAVSGLPEPRLLDAAHIMSDLNEQYGQPIVNNGIPLSKLHHAAFDAHLLGIDPDYRIHISRRLLDMRDGPTLEALRQFDRKTLLPPKRSIDQPDKDRLAMRFEIFKSAA